MQLLIIDKKTGNIKFIMKYENYEIALKLIKGKNLEIKVKSYLVS